MWWKTIARGVGIYLLFVEIQNWFAMQSEADAPGVKSMLWYTGLPLLGALISFIVPEILGNAKGTSAPAASTVQTPKKEVVTKEVAIQTAKSVPEQLVQESIRSLGGEFVLESDEEGVQKMMDLSKYLKKRVPPTNTVVSSTQIQLQPTTAMQGFTTIQKQPELVKVPVPFKAGV